MDTYLDNISDVEIRDQTRLSGAGVRRFRSYISMGLPHAEALRRARMPKISRKKQLIKGPKHVPINMNKEVDTCQSSSTVPVTLDTCIVIGIMHSDYPNVHLTSNELVLIEEFIVDKILELGRGAFLKPKFLNSVHGNGFLELSCIDRATAEWLKRLQHKLLPWQNASLVVKEDTIYCSRETFMVRLPVSHHDTVDKVCSLIDAQNEGIYSHTWQILERQVDNNCLQLVVSVDRECVGKLRESAFKLNYKFAQVEFKKVNESENQKVYGPNDSFLSSTQTQVQGISYNTASKHMKSPPTNPFL